jgi:hypothetical protein
MDTRFWGPSGWRLLHLITFTYDPAKCKEGVKEMFEMLPYVLPCKFCRQSLSEYYETDPLVPALKSKKTLSRWLWRIHNAVNGKLRAQGLNTSPDPSFAEVQKVYAERVAAGCIRTDFEGWDFLFSVAENHPFTQSAKNSLALPIPEGVEANTPDLRNRWNVMKADERMEYYGRFWKSLGCSLPFPEWRGAWKECEPRMMSLQNKRAWMKELWRIRCCLENRLELVNREEFGTLCKRLAEHRSGCGRKRRAKTCRRVKKGSASGFTKRETRGR